MTTRRDFLALAAGAVGATAAVPAMALPDGGSVGGIVSPNHPDAELIQLCAQHVANLNAFASDEGDDDESNPVWLAYLRTKEAIDDAEPQTIAGMVAKARAAKAQARCPDGTDDMENGPAVRWAFGLVNDLLRLYGEASA